MKAASLIAEVEMDTERELKILDLEDNEDDAELMVKELRRGGLRFTTRRVWTREALLRELEDFRPDLIIADYTLPAYDGLTALKDVRERCDDVPFLFLSGTMGEELAIETLKKGAADYILKNRLSKLSAAVKRALQEREDRTARRMAEESFRESEEKFRGLAASARDAIIMIDNEGRISYWNPSASLMFGYSCGEAMGRDMHTLIAPDRYREGCRKSFDHFRNTGDGPFIGKMLELFALRKDGTEFPVELSISALKIKDQWHAISILRDISERRNTEAVIQHQLENITALRDIEIAITSTLDLRVTLNMLLERVISQLRVDSADVLLLDQDTMYLNYAAGIGFRTKAIRHTRVRLGKGHVGQAALERRRLIIPDVSAIVTHALEEEAFITYIAVPLIARGRITGVLEIFNRTALDPSAEWLNFLDLIAGQAAIAIDNAGMFDTLQRANAELTLSYDVTLEGWGRSLEFRDADTKGHTERVAGMTVHLAGSLGLGERDLVHMRRGALLHDIGKINIPDSILRKPGPLTPEETEIMKMHTVYAFDLLSPVPFLRFALDIPYCHHERWDGSGYPRGLRGEQIPFSARIFAVIDVADALVSDRPYRRAWSVEKTYEYIKSLKGIHFDPKVVEAFLDMKWDRASASPKGL